jgi:hypothetical protein
VSGSLSAAESRRFDSFMIEVIASITGARPVVCPNDEVELVDCGGLFVNRRKGCFYCFGSGICGWHTLDAVIGLGRGPFAEAVKYARAWLANNPGTGSLVIAEGADDDAEDAALWLSKAYANASREQAQSILDTYVPVLGTRGEVYLRSRSLPPPYPDCIGFLEHARIGEGALVGVLRDKGRVVGCQLTYLDLDAKKSVVAPPRKTFKLERSPGAVFVLRPPPPVEPRDAAVDLAIAEGLEDGLSLLQMPRRFAVIALPGIDALRHTTVADYV